MGPDPYTCNVWQCSILAYPVQESLKVIRLPISRAEDWLTRNSHLRPGCGWLEHVEIDWTPQCKGGSWPPDFQTLHLFQELFSAMDEVNMPMRVDPGATKERLLAAGFVDISEERIQILWNPWPPNLDEKEVGRWFNLGLTQGLEAIIMAPLTRVKGWTDEEVRNFVKHCQLEISRQQIHGHFWL